MCIKKQTTLGRNESYITSRWYGMTERVCKSQFNKCNMINSILYGGDAETIYRYKNITYLYKEFLNYFLPW